MQSFKSGINVIKNLMGEEKYREKMENKQFLLGRFQKSLTDKLARKAKRNKKIDKSKLRNLLEIQAKPFANLQIRYEQVTALNKLWNSYMTQLLESQKSQESIVTKLLKADLHGCLLTVLQSKTQSYVGQMGIVLKQTLRTFEIITKDDRILIILKKNSVFWIRSDVGSYRVYGCNLVYRPADRVKHKFKWKVATDFIVSCL